MSKIYPMPKYIKSEFGVFIYLSNMYKRFSNVQFDRLVFDFSFTKHIDKCMLSVLGLIFTKLKSQQNEVYLRNVSAGLKNMLLGYGFIKLSFLKEDILPNYISYKTFNGDENDKYRNYLTEEMKEMKESELIRYLITHVMEIFLNVKTHARVNPEKSKYGNKEVFSSGYFNEEEQYLTISICNNGMTFSENIFQKIKIEYLNEFEYIKWALKQLNSTTENRPGGAGLAMLKELIIESNGELIICSGKGYYSFRFDENKIKTEEEKNLSAMFPGTAICIKVPILPINDNLETDFEQEFSVFDILESGSL